MMRRNPGCDNAEYESKSADRCPSAGRKRAPCPCSGSSPLSAAQSPVSAAESPGLRGIRRSRGRVERSAIFDAELPGGLAIYGRRFGRYPLDPTVIFLLRR